MNKQPNPEKLLRLKAGSIERSFYKALIEASEFDQIIG
jgi:hypothetical protein